MRLEFEPVGHVYRLNGVRVPSVTDVVSMLEDFSGIPPAVLETARVFGGHVHDAVALDIRGVLDWSNLAAPLVPYLNAWRRFVADSGIVITASELRVAHAKLGYAGRLDLKGLLNKAPAIIDVKSGEMPASVGPQTAGYEEALSAAFGIKVRRRFCLQLNPAFSCGYKLHSLDKRTDWTTFVSALNVWNFRHAA
jgi:hypothetical protein